MGARAGGRQPLPDLPRAGGPAGAVREGDGLHAHRAAAGDGASVLRIVGLPGASASSRRPAASARRRTSSSSSTPAIRPGIGVILDWVPGHFPEGRARPRALRRHRALRARRSAAGRAPDWGTLIFNYGRNEVRNFLLSNALFWLEEYHIDGLRVDAVASMLYLDYSRQRRASGFRTSYGGRENLEAIEFLQQLNALTHGEHPGTITAAEESTAWPGVSRPVHLGGLGFTYKWNMGWMHDMLEYMQGGSGPPPLAPQPDHVLDALLPTARTSSCRSRTTKSCTASARCSTRCRATSGRSTRRCARSTATCTGIRARSCCSWAASSGSGASGTTIAASTGTCSTIRRTPALQPLRAGSQPRSISAEPALHEARLRAGRLPLDRLQRQREQRRLARPLRAAIRATSWSMVFNFTPVPRDGYRIGVPEAGLLRRAAEQRRGGLRRQQRRQPGRRRQRSRSPRTASISRCA